MFAQTRSWRAALCHPARGSSRVLTRCGAELGTGRGPRLHLSAHMARRGGWFCVGAEGKMRELGDGRVCLDSGVLLECHSLCRTPFPPQQTCGASSARSAQAPGRGAQVRGTGRRHWAQVPGLWAWVQGTGARDAGVGRRCQSTGAQALGAGAGRRCRGAGRRCRGPGPGAGRRRRGAGHRCWDPAAPDAQVRAHTC